MKRPPLFSSVIAAGCAGSVSRLKSFHFGRKTQRAQAEESASALQALARASADGIALVDRERRLRLTNSIFRGMFGIAAEMAGESLLDGRAMTPPPSAC